MQLTGHGPGQSVPYANAVWSERPILRFDPARTKILPTTVIDAIVDADPDESCTMVVLIQQDGQTLRMEDVELIDDENFFKIPIRIKPTIGALC